MNLTTSLGAKQRQFSFMIAKLILKAYDMGYEITFGDAYRDPRAFGPMGSSVAYGRANSAHKQRLAIDLNLFKDGTLLTSSSDHEPLGKIWEGMGGTWGGRFKDGNHYSLEHNGIK